MSKDNYTNRVTKCFELLNELLTKYPRSIDEVEKDLAGNLEFYKDYVPQDKDTYIKEIRNSSNEVVALELVMSEESRKSLYHKLCTLKNNSSPLALDLED